MTRTLLLRNSERQSFKTCRHKWQWSYMDGRQAAEAPYALRFGDLIHRALADYYIPGIKRGPAPADNFARHYNADAAKLEEGGFDIWSDDKWTDALDLGYAMLEGYVKEFGGDKEWKVIASEMTFQIPIRGPLMRLLPHYKRERFMLKAVGTLDGVWQHRKVKSKFIFKEFKTAANITLDGLAMDEQASVYWTYGPRFLKSKGILKEDQMPSEILYTFLRKAVPNPDDIKNADGYKVNKPSKDALEEHYASTGRALPPGTGAKGAVKVEDMMKDLGVKVWAELSEISKVQPKPYFARTPVYRDDAERARQHDRIIEESLDIARAREGGLYLYKNPGMLHMPNCRGCSFREACEVHEAGGDYISVLNATTIPWNPYAAHELPERK